MAKRTFVRNGFEFILVFLQQTPLEELILVVPNVDIESSCMQALSPMLILNHIKCKLRSTLNSYRYLRKSLGLFLRGRGLQ